MLSIPPHFSGIQTKIKRYDIVRVAEEKAKYNGNLCKISKIQMYLCIHKGSVKIKRSCLISE